VQTDSHDDRLDWLVGTWTTEATHPAMPGVVVRGTAVIEWLEGKRFLSHRARNDHPDFPDSLSVIGHMGRDRAGAEDSEPSLRMHYFDSRGVFRVYETSMDDTSWRMWRDSSGFSQRFAGRRSADGDAIDGQWQLCRDDVHWADDLQITYRRQH
jgi:hypothetical protein